MQQEAHASTGGRIVHCIVFAILLGGECSESSIFSAGQADLLELPVPDDESFESDKAEMI